VIPGVVKLCDFGKWMRKFLLSFYCWRIVFAFVLRVCAHVDGVNKYLLRKKYYPLNAAFLVRIWWSCCGLVVCVIMLICLPKILLDVSKFFSIYDVDSGTHMIEP